MSSIVLGDGTFPLPIPLPHHIPSRFPTPNPTIATGSSLNLHKGGGDAYSQHYERVVIDSQGGCIAYAVSHIHHGGCRIVGTICTGMVGEGSPETPPRGAAATVHSPPPPSGICANSAVRCLAARWSDCAVLAPNAHPEGLYRQCLSTFFYVSVPRWFMHYNH